MTCAVSRNLIVSSCQGFLKEENLIDMSCTARDKVMIVYNSPISGGVHLVVVPSPLPA